MPISVCITVKNEEATVGELLESLLQQTKKTNEIIIVDAKSTDRTVEIIKHWQQKDKRIKLIIEKGSIAHGRNLAIEISKGDIIVTTDAGCVAKKDWLEKITQPFTIDKVDVVAGFYEMDGNTSFLKALKPFLGIVPERYNMLSFLPSARSMAFRKSVWEAVFGFRENLDGAGEDSAFNYDLIKAGFKITRIKDAVVVWQIPENLKLAFRKFFDYAKGDVKTKIWIHPSEHIMSHNIHALLIIIRYLIFAGLILLTALNILPFYSVILFSLLYLFYPLWKFRDLEIGWWARGWLPVIQITSDLAVICGLTAGILYKA